MNLYSTPDGEIEYLSDDEHYVDHQVVSCVR